MSLALLIALLQTAAPPVADAEALAAKGDAETLFLQYGSVKSADYPEPERLRLAAALLKAAKATRQDPFVAVSLAGRAAALNESPEALVLLAEVEIDLDQRESAALHLDRALELDPKRGATLLARAELAAKEQDFALAASLFGRAQQAGVKGLKPKIAKAQAEADKKSQAVVELKETEQRIQTKVAAAAKSATRDWMRQLTQEEEEESERRRLAPDGVRKQEIRNFAFTYSTGKRSAGQIYEFEKKVERLLEKTYDFVADKLGYKLEKRTNVVLMSRQEYMAAHAGTPQISAGGYWDGQKIVINGGSTLDERFAEVMVHEFTHAVVSALTEHGDMRVPRWVNEGLAENMRMSANGQNGRVSEGGRRALAELKKREVLPKLAELDAMFVSMGNGVEVAYLLAGVAAEVMVDKRGYSSYVDMLREMRRSTKPLEVVESYYSDLERLESDIVDAID